MSRIAIEDVAEFAKLNFPQAPERLAEFLGVKIRRSPLPLDCDGWCLQVNDRSIIRINSSTSELRQRFTLAHELGHLLLNIPSTIGESMLDVQKQSSEEEKRVNTLAGEILLPVENVKSLVRQVPVTAATIKKIAKAANISDVVVARRLASLSVELGLKRGFVLFYKKNVYEWCWPYTKSLTTELAQDLLNRSLEANPDPARIHRKEKRDVIVASVLENPHFESMTVFVQVVSEDIGLKQLDEERTRDLKSYIFADGTEFQQSLAACLGAMKSQVKGLSQEKAVELFNNRYMEDPYYLDKWSEDFRNRLKSVRGQEYISLRLKIWL